MRGFLIFLFIAVLFGAVLALGDHVLQSWRDHGKSSGILKPVPDTFEVTAGASDQSINRTMPALPDISGYTVASVKSRLPAIKPGEIALQNSEDTYVRAKRLILDFKDKIEPFQPSIISLENGVFDLQSILETVNDEAYFYRNDEGAYVLLVPLVIKPDATLVMRSQDKLLMSQFHGVALFNFGTFYAVEADIRGWDINQNSPAIFAGDKSFRPYIVSWCGSEMHLAGSFIAHLGYFSSKAYGVTYTSCSDTIYKRKLGHLAGATGSMIDNRVYDVYYGFYTYEAHDIALIGNEFTGVIYGIDPHDRSERLIIANNIVRNTKRKHGIIVSREVNDSFIFGNVSEYNKGSGFMLDRSSVNNVVANNVSRYNEGDGLTFFESSHNWSYGNVISNNEGSGIRLRNSTNITFVNDVVSHNKGMGIEIYTDDLTADGGERDLEMDPYEQKAEATFINTEMVGNQKGQFKIINADRIMFENLKTLQNPDDFFAGDFQDTGLEKRKELSTSGQYLMIQKK